MSVCWDMGGGLCSIFTENKRLFRQMAWKQGVNSHACQLSIAELAAFFFCGNLCLMKRLLWLHLHKRHLLRRNRPGVFWAFAC